MYDFSIDPTFRDAPLAYGVFAADGRLLAANARLSAMFELAEARSLSLITSSDPADRDKITAQLAVWIEGEEGPTGFESRWVRSGGSVFWSRVTATVTDVDGERALLVIFEDIDTERRLRTLESNAAGERTAMVTRASHELRNPLNVISGLAELLTETDLPEASRQQVAAIRREAAGLTRVVSDLLEIGRAGVGNLPIHREDFALRPLVARLSRVHGPAAAAKGVTLALEIDDAAPLVVDGDADRLLQVLSNVVGNAVKFTDVGSVTVRVDEPESGKIRFEVSDCGPGVPDPYLRAIFEPFVQADHDRPGAGLGLSIAASFVELMGGHITVANTEQGACFTIVVPLPVVDSPSVGSEPAPRAFGQRSTGRVLVVEDSPENQLLFRGQLDAHGLEHDVVDNGFEALHVLEEQDYSLVLMDWHLPDISGLETIRRWRLREFELGRDRVPIVAVTARAMASDARRCLDAGADDYLRKPASLSDIGRVASAWLPSEPDRRSPDGVLNREAIDAILDDVGDAGLVATLLRTYLDELPKRVERIVGAGRGVAGASEVEEAAHVLKSTSAMVGGASLAALAARIESSARDGDLPTETERGELQALATDTECGIRSIVARLEVSS